MESKDKIIQIASVVSSEDETKVYGLSESGKLYITANNHGNLEWQLFCDSPKGD